MTVQSDASLEQCGVRAIQILGHDGQPLETGAFRLLLPRLEQVPCLALADQWRAGKIDLEAEANFMPRQLIVGDIFLGLKLKGIYDQTNSIIELLE